MKNIKLKEIRGFLFLFVSLVVVVAIVKHLNIQPLSFFSGIPNLFEFFSDALPPDATLLSTSLTAIIETIEIALLGTLLGFVLALPLGVLGARNLFSKNITVPVRIFLATIRTLPSLLWAVIFVIMVGLGPFAGVLATTLYTIGYLSKLQYEAIEGINPSPIDAVKASGANKIQIIRFVIIPESANNLLSQLLFMFEYNVRASSILGFVGAGGIGFYIVGYLKLLEYDKVLTLLLIILCLVLIIDVLSVKIRDRYLVK